jgi:hypothetical protein
VLPLLLLNGHQPEKKLGAFVIGTVEILETVDESAGAMVNPGSTDRRSDSLVSEVSTELMP